MGIFERVLNSKKIFKCDAKYYKLDTLDQIESIPVPNKKFDHTCDFKNSIEYVLQRKATEYKRQGNLDLAIACLRKSNEIMPYSPMSYAEKDYMRLINYLREAKRFDEAKIESEKISKRFKNQNISKDIYKRETKTASDLSLHTFEVPRGYCVCGECAKYHDRIYSDKKDTRFPSIDLFRDYINNKKCLCHLVSFAFDYGITHPVYIKMSGNKLIEYCNRPFTDDRSTDEILEYEKHMEQILSDEKDRNDYNWILEHLPEIAPKSFVGYRKMKNIQSKRYLEILSLAKSNGYII